MADLVVNAANVLPGANAQLVFGDTAGEAITAGQSIYKDPVTNKMMKSDSDSANAAAKKADGLASCNAAANQPLVWQKKGDITMGNILTAGATYFVSNTAGGICPDADVGAGENVCLLGVARSATVLALDIRDSGVSR